MPGAHCDQNMYDEGEFAASMHACVCMNCLLTFVFSLHAFGVYVYVCVCVRVCCCLPVGPVHDQGRLKLFTRTALGIFTSRSTAGMQQR